MHPEEYHHRMIANELVISHYTLLRACNNQLCMWPCSFTKNISGC